MRIDTYPGDEKNPFENKNKHIRSKGPTPNTKRTIFAVLGVVFFSPAGSMDLTVIFFFEFLLGISKNRLLQTITDIIIYELQKNKRKRFTSYPFPILLNYLIIK